MAQSTKIFQDTLCESRSYAVETTDPTGARTIDELKKLVKELRVSLEREKVKNKQLVWDHEKQLQRIREEEAKRLDTSLESCSLRKEQEKLTELKKLEERLEKQKNQELHQLAKEKTEELNRSFRKWQVEKNEAVRVAVETEKRLSLEEFQASFNEEETLARENKLTREVFTLIEQNESLEQQVKNLSRLNRAQIDQMRRMKQECDIKIENIIRQHKTEASREIAQLKLAEQIIAEKDHSLRTIEYRAEMAMMEKEALEEEVTAMRSIHNVNASHSLESTPTRRSLGGSGVLQKRVDELENQLKKLEEEKVTLKQDNASLRKRLFDEGEKKTVGGKADEDKIKMLRKKNAELTTLTKELDDKVKALGVEKEQLQQKLKSGLGESEQQVRKNMARQHARDISEYTKQIHGKDRELTELRKKIAKLEAAALTYSEPSPELEKKVKSMSMDKLRMEKLSAKLYSRLPNVDVKIEEFSRKELATETNKLEQLVAKNKVLQSKIEQLERSREEEVDVGRTNQTSLSPEMEEILAENNRLKDLAQLASKLESENASLKQSINHLEATNVSLEQRCHELSQKLEISVLAVKELDGLQDFSVDLERQVEIMKEQARLKGNEITALKMECHEKTAQLNGKQTVICVLQKQVEELENCVQEKDQQCIQLQATLDEINLRTKPSLPTTETVFQVHKTEELTKTATPFKAMNSSSSSSVEAKPDMTTTNTKKVSKDSPVHRNLRSRSPRTSSGDLMDSSLDNEMRAAGIDINDSFDSSEGVGFSDTNLEVSVVGSDQSLAVREDSGEIPAPAAESQGRTQLSDGDLPHKIAWATGQPQASDSDRAQVRQDEGVIVDGQEFEEIRNDEAVSESEKFSNDELINDRESGESHTPHSEGDKVCVYIAKYSYNPAEMSPNPNFDLELSINAGDYLYIYGEMDDDGFYHGQLMSGESGMVPSNFIERVPDDEELDGSQAPHKERQKHSTFLQDIEEVDEDTSSGGVGYIPPPYGLTLDRQFVEGGLYSVAIKWEPPHPLPEGAVGYSVYVNGEHNSDVNSPEQNTVLLTGIPRKQLVKISVRTIVEEGESQDPAKLVILNPQYPESPTNITLSRSISPQCLVVHWAPSKPLKEGNPINGYAVYLNNHLCVQLGSNPTPAKVLCTQILASDLKDFKDKIMKDKVVSLTVCSISGGYLSAPSLPLVVSKDDLIYVCSSIKMTADESEITSSAASLSSIEDEEEKELYEPSQNLIAEVQEGGEGVGLQSQEVEFVAVEENGIPGSPPTPEPPTNGESERPTGPVKYYRALARYDPILQSPNEDAEEELGFYENDIIIGLTPIGEDEFLMGELNGKTGYVPSNLLEEVTDQEELSHIQTILHNQATKRQDTYNMNGSQSSLDGTQKMKVLFDYDPAQDSPNANSEVELAINEGDIVTVFGKPDSDGFFKAELAGKKGLVPCNFLQEITPPRNDEIEVFAADEDSMKIANAIIQRVDAQSNPLTQKSSEIRSSPKQKGIFSQGMNILSKGKQGK